MLRLVLQCQAHLPEVRLQARGFRKDAGQFAVAGVTEAFHLRIDPIDLALRRLLEFFRYIHIEPGSVGIAVSHGAALIHQPVANFGISDDAGCQGDMQIQNIPRLPVSST